MADDKSLESRPVKEPDLLKITNELDQASSDIDNYVDRLEHCRNWWHNHWPGQTYDGRKHADKEQEIVEPWEGASDSRLRIVDTLIDEFVSSAKAAFRGARTQVRSTRPLLYGRRANVTQKVLEWLVKIQMKREILRETWFAWAWKFGFGLSFMWIEWEQQRTKGHEQITVDTLARVAQELNTPVLMDLDGDEESQKMIADFLQELSPILARDEARKIISDLRNTGVAQLPLVNLTVNKPKWTACLPAVDIILPSETCEIQDERFVDRRELVTETQLVDRITTDGYNSDFVEEVLKHKGEFSEWMEQPGWRYLSTGSERDMIELHHFIYKSVVDEIPCLYRTVFSYPCAPMNLYATHKVFEYKHNQYPLVAFRRTHDYRPLLSSVGLAEEAYTDEQDIKTQQDGLTDRCELINSPPMIVPTLRSQAHKSNYGPRAVMSALRPGEVSWPPLPPSDNTPIQVIQMVQARLDRRYSISGPEVDPQMRVIRTTELSEDTATEMELVLEQTLQLAQQYLTDADVERVAGHFGQSWNATTQDIQGKFEIAVSYDPRMADIEYVKDRMSLYQMAMQFNQGGTAKVNKLFQRILSLVDPDAEDLIEENEGDATGREIDEEDQATVAILSGLEPRFPQHGNHKLRMQRLISNTFQNQDPAVLQKIAGDKMIQKRIQSRMQNFQRQVQQFEVNPQIGRSLATKAGQPNVPAEIASE